MYREYLSKQYSKVVVSQYYSYAVKYQAYLSNASKISELPISIKSNVLKSLIALSKYLGIYTEFTKDFKNSGIKWIKPSALDAFNHIVNGSDADLVEWYQNAVKAIPDQYKLLLEYTLRSGLRRNEAINSFTLIQDLSEKGRLNEYYNTETSMLEHFRFKDLFIRKTKNCFISVCSKDLIDRITKSNRVYYTTLRKALQKAKLPLRIKELRSYNNSYLRKHNILSEYIDILSGRIPESIFVRNYLKEALLDLSRQIQPIQDQLIKSVS